MSVNIIRIHIYTPWVMLSEKCTVCVQRVSECLPSTHESVETNLNIFFARARVSPSRPGVQMLRSFEPYLFECFGASNISIHKFLRRSSVMLHALWVIYVDRWLHLERRGVIGGVRKVWHYKQKLGSRRGRKPRGNEGQERSREVTAAC